MTLSSQNLGLTLLARQNHVHGPIQAHPGAGSADVYVCASCSARSANPDFQARLRRVFITVGQAPDHELMPYTFRPYPGHDSIQKLGRMDMRPAVDTLSDILSQVSLTERDADPEFL